MARTDRHLVSGGQLRVPRRSRPVALGDPLRGSGYNRRPISSWRAVGAASCDYPIGPCRRRVRILQHGRVRRGNSDLDWRLQRAAVDLDAAQHRQALLDQCAEAGWSVDEGHDPTSTHRGARRLADLGVDHDDHGSEDCHLVVITRPPGNRPTMTPWCTTPRRHNTKGTSTVKTTIADQATGAERDEEAAAREAKRAAKAAKTHRDTFVRAAINTKLRGRDLTDFVLPVLFDTAGQTELTAAGKLLDVEPNEPQYTGAGKDYATPLREWARASTANLTRAMLAIAYVHASVDPTYAGDSWRQASKDAVAAWLDGLGYHPEQ